jgi:hypothetical protein
MLDLRVVVGDLGKDRVLQPCRGCSATAAPVVGSGQRAASRINDVACAVWLDASAKTCLTFVRGHGRMFGDFFDIAMPIFLSGSSRLGWGVWYVMFASLANFYSVAVFYCVPKFLYVLFFFFLQVRNKTY